MNLKIHDEKVYALLFAEVGSMQKIDVHL